MSAADDAYKAAEKLIAKARRQSDTALDLDLPETHALTRLPPEIGSLTELQSLFLDNTQVTDLAPLQGLTGLQVLTLDSTPVTDLAPLQGLTGLQSLHLNNTQVTDLAPLQGLTGLQTLWLNSTQVTDLADLLGLTGLKALTLTDTKVTDLAPLRGLTGLQSLHLNNTQVTDLAPLQGLTGLQTLWLNSTQVTDLADLLGLTGLKALTLTDTKVTDLAPLRGLTGLQSLHLNNTPVTDLAPLQGLTDLRRLYLDGTQVIDLRPVRDLTSLIDGAEKMRRGSLNFQNTPATRADPELARLSRIEDDVERTEATLTYLRTLPPLDQPLPGAADDEGTDTEPVVPVLPERSPAPLETEIADGQLRRAAPARPFESDDPAAVRAQMAWEELSAFSQDFQRSFNVSNYAPLPEVLGAFDRSLAKDFARMRQIGVGIHGMRLAALSRDTEFCARLPDGCTTELGSFALAIETLVNRFPDWVAYKEDAEKAPEIAKDVSEARDAFESLYKTLTDTAAVSAEVTEEFEAEIKGVADDPHSEELAKGIVNSTRDVVLTVSEVVVAEARSGEKFRQFVERQRATGKTEWPKAEYWAAGVWFDLLGRGNPHLRKLTKRFPSQLGWIDRVLDYCGFPQE